MIIGLNFSNSEIDKSKIILDEPPILFARFFPECNPKVGVPRNRFRQMFKDDIASGRMKCSDKEFLSMSYLMIL